MYYNQETIESELECKLCKNQFNDPRLLPCGNTCCLSCIISISIEDRMFKCPCCESKHKAKDDPNDYPVQNTIVNLLNTTKMKIDSQFIKLDFEQKLEDFYQNLNDLSDKHDNLTEHLNNYCESLRCQILIKTDSFKEILNRQYEEALLKINEFEKEITEKWKLEQESNTNQINENRKIYNEMKDYIFIKEPKRQDIEQAILKIKSNSTQIQNESERIKNSLFSLKLIPNNEEFVFPIVADILRVLKCEKLELTNQRSNYSIFDAAYSGEKLFIYYYNDEYDAIVSTCMHVYNEKPVFKFEKGNSDVSKVESFYLFGDYLIETQNGKIYIYKQDSILQDASSKYTFKKKLISICATDSIIAALDHKYKMICYSFELEYLKSIGQNENKNEPFYFNGVKQIDIRDGTLYLRRNNSIELMNESNGIVIKSIQVNNNYKFIIDDEMKQLIVFSYDGIYRYDLESGNSISKIDTINSIPKGYKFVQYKDGRYLLKSRNNKCLYQITF
jgi:hypothetical protein